SPRWPTAFTTRRRRTPATRTCPASTRPTSPATRPPSSRSPRRGRKAPAKVVGTLRVPSRSDGTRSVPTTLSAGLLDVPLRSASLARNHHPAPEQVVREQVPLPTFHHERPRPLRP